MNIVRIGVAGLLLAAGAATSLAQGTPGATGQGGASPKEMSPSSPGDNPGTGSQTAGSDLNSKNIGDLNDKTGSGSRGLQGDDTTVPRSTQPNARTSPGTASPTTPAPQADPTTPQK